MDDERLEKQARIDREIERLKGGIASLDRDVKQVKYVLLAGFLAIPAGLFIGKVAATLVVLFTASLFATALYLIGVRRREYQGLIEDARRDRERIGAAEGL